MPRFYFNLAEARRLFATGETPWTPAVSVLFQLDVSLDMLEAEGYPQIFARHAACAAATRAGLIALGFELFADPAHASKTVTAARVPDGVEWKDLNRELRDRGLVLAGGQGRLTGKILRVGHLGAVNVRDIVAAMEILGQAAQALGLSADPSAGARAAQDAADALASQDAGGGAAAEDAAEDAAEQRGPVHAEA